MIYANSIPWKDANGLSADDNSRSHRGVQLFRPFFFKHRRLERRKQPFICCVGIPPLSRYFVEGLDCTLRAFVNPGFRAVVEHRTVVETVGAALLIAHCTVAYGLSS